MIPPKVERRQRRARTVEEETTAAANREKAAPYIERRVALGLTKKELAEKAGVDPATVRGMEAGRYSPCWETRQKIRCALGMPEERYYTIEERNAIFLDLQEQGVIRRAINRNITPLRAVHGKKGGRPKKGHSEKAGKNPAETQEKPGENQEKDKERDKNKEMETDTETDGVESAPPAPSPAALSPIIGLPLNDGTEYGITEEQCREWAELYPAVDVLQELRNMRGWLLSNKGRRKTKRGIDRFITGWLSREQDRGYSNPQQNRRPESKGDYKNFEGSTGFRSCGSPD